MHKVLVAGAGPAGMMAAIQAARNGAEVILLEKNNRPGRKIMITGKGRCNVTNAASIPDFFENITGNKEFLYSAFKKFSNKDLMDFFENLGVSLKVERGSRVFPVSDKASDIVDALKRELIKNKVNAIYNQTISAVLTKDGKACGIKTKNSTIEADAVIIATGGLTYPATGSTGDGYKIASSLGHDIIKPGPSLVPLETSEKWVKDLTGLSLKNIEAKLLQEDNVIESEFGEMLFTHFGVSGPVILTLSRKAVELLKTKNGKVYLVIDLKPALSFEQLEKRLLRDFEKFSRRQLKNSLDDLLPNALIPVIIHLSGIYEEKFVNQISREERHKIVNLLKNLKLTLTKPRPVEEAIITAGGVSTKEVNPKTMESKIIPGLFFAGEILDVDANTGGFNFQIAFSTGFVAGTEAANKA
ncbi:MAG: NAD(P)/FAD-dependent oxidoreductase [Firmicutes bacterium]|nr:NAD(P)/FAD-dependent oxidoreductase [Bacillota bacterium]